MIICIEVNIEKATDGEDGTELDESQVGRFYECGDEIATEIENTLYGLEVEVQDPDGDEFFILSIDVGTPWVQKPEVRTD